MNIIKIEVDHFRLLDKFSLDVEDSLSLVIGKNNVGKTSILSVLDKFINYSERNKFSYDDFNLEYKKKLKEFLKKPLIEDEDYNAYGIKLRLFIQYTESCNLEHISRIMMDLDPDNNYIVLEFGYLLSHHNYSNLKKDYEIFKSNEEEKRKGKQDYVKKKLDDFLASRHSEYFKVIKKSLEIDKDTKKVNDKNFIDLDKEKIALKDIINFKYISARREVANKEVDKTLSTQTSIIYDKSEATPEQKGVVEEFKDQLCDTDQQLSEIYTKLFQNIVGKVQQFGGMKPNDSNIEIISSLQHRELLKGNTTVVYNQGDENKLPEYYNGLGYMNLIYMIFEIEILIQEFKRTNDFKPADINLLFIEEPEAHTHPQMQSVFIKNIKSLIGKGITRNDGEKRNLQYIITTHSSHIVANSDFDDVKYIKKQDNNSVVAKNLKALKNEYDKEGKQYQFLTQYLTINRAEIFFATKAILIEGDTERILLPTFMKKIDLESEGDEDTSLFLLSQNISIIEVGAYSHIFDIFIDFLGIKTLIITDLDSVNEDDKACRVSEGKSFSNASLKHYFGKPTTLEELKNCKIVDKCFKKSPENTWVNDPNGNLCIVYQTEERGYTARSFEDAFIHINKLYIKNNIGSFESIKKPNNFSSLGKDAYDLANECIKKKTYFAMDVLFHSGKRNKYWEIPTYIKNIGFFKCIKTSGSFNLLDKDVLVNQGISENVLDLTKNLFYCKVDYSNWEIPSYIKEGLLWLKKD